MGAPLVLNVSKEPNADTLKVSELANQVIDRYAKQEKFQAVVLMDHGEEINTSISKLLKEGMYGALFTILVIAVFLRSFRATLISIFSLPISILATIFFPRSTGLLAQYFDIGWFGRCDWTDCG